MSAKKKVKRKLSKEVASIRLLRAAARWVEAYDGVAIVGGGISTEVWPTDPPAMFYVRVKIAGRKPKAKVKRENTPKMVQTMNVIKDQRLSAQILKASETIDEDIRLGKLHSFEEAFGEE